MLAISLTPVRGNRSIYCVNAHTGYTTIVTVRDADPFLGEAISSVLDQTLPPTKVLVVVNGTNDSSCPSMRVTASFGEPVQGVTISDAGLVPGLNYGLRQVETPFVSFLDSDDLWVRTKQENQISMLLEDPAVDGVNCHVTNFRDDPTGKRHFSPPVEGSVLGAVTFRSSAFTRFGNIDPSSTHFTHLYRWFAQARRNGLKIARGGEDGLLRRLHSDNGWVVAKKHGLAELHTELRRVMQERRSTSLSSQGASLETP